MQGKNDAGLFIFVSSIWVVTAIRDQNVCYLIPFLIPTIAELDQHYVLGITQMRTLLSCLEAAIPKSVWILFLPVLKANFVRTYMSVCTSWEGNVIGRTVTIAMTWTTVTNAWVLGAFPIDRLANEDLTDSIIYPDSRKTPSIIR